MRLRSGAAHMAVSTPPHPTTSPPPARRPSVRAGDGLRPEIQALRAVAVGVVVAYHLFPRAVPGGFIGVDVFFAISGFLISAHLLREVDRTGRVSLAGFWARRARRILPAALLVLFVSAVATLLLVPQDHWGQYLAEIRASTAYVQNWHLASDAVDYLAAANAPSPVQHFWSLSVEEQFYLVWPVLILLAVAVTRGRSLVARRRAVGALLGLAAAASLAYCLYDTSADQARAFFVTTTRAWEFAAGGLLAFVGTALVKRDGLRAALSWGGLAVIAYGVWGLSGQTAFPGTAALIPVLGAVAVMAAGAPRHGLGPTRVMALRPVQWLGGVSYAVYLWHWPLLILWPYAFDREPGALAKLAIVALTLGLAQATKVLVEDPVRSSSWLTRHRTGWTFGAVLVGTACVFATAAIGQSKLDATVKQDVQQAKRVLDDRPRCFGAASSDPGKPCVNPALRTQVIPTPAAAAKLENTKCQRVDPLGFVHPCAFGAPAAGAKGTVALIGDSHAAHWRAALNVVANQKGWHGVSLSRTSCPLSRATKDLVEPQRSQCRTWNAQVPRWLERHPEVTTVFLAAISGTSVIVSPGETQRSAQVSGYERAMRSLPPSVKHVVVLRDTPKVRSSTASCVTDAIARRADAGRACAVSRRTALRFDPQAAAAREIGAPRAQVVSLDDALCGPRTCRPVIGGALVYKDIHHFTRVFAATLGPLLGRRIDALGVRVG